MDIMHTVNRLTKFFSPNSYELDLSIDRPGRKFEGNIKISGATPSESNSIRLHIKDLLIKNVVVDNNEITSFEYKKDLDELLINVDNLPAGNHDLTISYSGKINDQMHGMYPCYFKDNGQDKELIATQFESHHAREVFPCIDEPEAKATYDVTLRTENNVSVLGNMPVKKQYPSGDTLVTEFETTPRMSSYLLAWVVGEMQFISAKTNKGVEVNIWSTPTQPIESLKFALETAVSSIEFYEQYFGVDYPLPKSDHVALPDFSSGAMENWGLITYREMALLADPKTTSIGTRQYIATVITHELAHQWFGNLVTMKWWNNLWLNESFATMMEYLAVDAIHPEWNIWLDFSTNENIMALRRDSIDGVQAVQVDVNHPDEINSLFDGAIVYAKGARLLRMLQSYVGNDDFQAGLNMYFKQYAYKNTEADDLWRCISSASSKDIKSMMDVWISQPGYPVLNVSKKSDKSVLLEQSQFFVGPHSPSDKLWPIPLRSSYDELPELFSEQVGTFNISKDSILRMNTDDSAHFISNYDEDLQNDLIGAVKNNEIDTLARLQFLHEATLLARAGLMPSYKLIDILEAFEDETEDQVWAIIFVALSELRKFVLNDKPAEKKLRQLSARTAKTQYGRLGWSPKPQESEDDSKLRSTIISLTLYGEDADAIKKAQEIYESNSLEDLDPELRPLIIGTVVRYGDGSVVDLLLDKYTSTSSSELQNDIASGITSTKITEKISQLLEAIKNDKIVRKQDVARWFVNLMRGKESQNTTWQWLKTNWQWIEDSFGSDKSYDDFPRYAALAISDDKLLEDYKEFFIPMKTVPALKRVISIGISEMEGRVDLIEKDGPAVRARLLDL